jgi:ABC-2 type transport system ATP-binding protein
MMDYAIHTEHLSYHFGAVKAVDDLTLDVPHGIVFGFFGPDGSGKTTTIRLLLGLLEPQQGKARVLGYDAQEQPYLIRKRTGALLERTGLYERLSAEDNLEFYGRINLMSTFERQARIKELLSQLGLWERRKERVGQWSRGMRRKVAVACTMLHHPAIIFLDEPTAGLDPIAAASLREYIATLVEQDGVTVFLNTHNLPEAEKLCALIGVMRNGKLLAIGSPERLKMDRAAAHLEITSSGISRPVRDQTNFEKWAENFQNSSPNNI